jgi:hypothetical protein
MPSALPVTFSGIETSGHLNLKKGQFFSKMAWNTGTARDRKYP